MDIIDIIMSTGVELHFRSVLSEYDYALLESQIEQAENKIREKHNATCKCKHIMSYRNNKFLAAISIVNRMIHPEVMECK